jgi:hypothetical protein
VIALNKVDKVWNACGRTAQRYSEAAEQIAAELAIVKLAAGAPCDCDRCQLYDVLISALLAPVRLRGQT